MPFFCFPFYGQIHPKEDVAMFEYRIIPDINDVEARTYTINANIFTTLLNGNLEFGLSYSNNQFSFFDQPTLLDEASYEETHILEASIAFEKKVTGSWSFAMGIAPTLASDFGNAVTHEDLILNASLAISKKWGHHMGHSTIAFGIAHGTAFGEPLFFPIATFTRKINEKWMYYLGIPRSGITTNINERHAIKAKALFSGSYSNISSTVTFDNRTIADSKLQYNGLDFGLEHDYRIQPNFTTVIRLGYAAVNNFEIVDNNDRLLYDFEPESSIYFNIGLKFNLNKNANESEL